ncbi:hypothetical protein J4425_00220 [Candidatus Woesearchaeota archaeon]|nr:hypothetical protein [Candidatus Woesearchaeota archaeon]
MVKNLNKVFLISLVFAVLIFCFGLYLGYSLDSLRVNDVNNLIYENELNTINYLSSKEFLDLFDENSSCSSTQALLKSISPELADLGDTLTSYENKGLFSQSDYKLLKIKYFLVELRSYVLFTELKKECRSDFDLVLYFYNQDHDSSRNQGYVLDSLVNSNDNVHVFSFDRSIEDSNVVKLLVSHYNITTAPSLVINDNAKLDGFVSLDEIRKILEDEA